MSSELYQTIEAIGREKGLDTDVVIQAIAEAYAAATRKSYRSKEDYGARFDRQTGIFEVFSKHLVVEDDDVADPSTEVALGEAREKNPEAEIGNTIYRMPRVASQKEQVDGAPFGTRGGLSVVHIAGSKGKGSTAELLATVLGSHGLRVGLYTSPHLISITERIRVDGTPIAEDDLADVLETVMDRGGIDGSPGAGQEPATFFDIMTVAAFEYFRRCRVDWAVIEAGLGGRLDSTNIVRPLAGIITSISLDHTASLGNDVESIAREKAGIIKPGMVVACDVSVSRGVAAVVRDACARAALTPIELGEPGCEIHAVDGESRFDVDLGQRHRAGRGLRASRRRGAGV